MNEQPTNREPPDAPPPRLLPHRSLPPYSYVTDRFPHPVRDARGHSFGQSEPQAAIGDPDEWRTCPAYLWGIDLFNAGYYWEAHEAWEAVWHAAGRTGVMADFAKALIKLAAACVKARGGRPHGVELHARRAAELLSSVASTLPTDRPHFMGLSPDRLIRAADQLAASPEKWVNTADEPVVRVASFYLLPADSA